MIESEKQKRPRVGSQGVENTIYTDFEIFKNDDLCSDTDSNTVSGAKIF